MSQSRPGALSRRPSASTLVRTPVGDRYVLEQMREQRLQRRRRAVRPHHPVGLHHHRRRPRRRAAGAGGGAEAPARPVSEVCHRFDPLPQILQERALSQRQAARRCRASSRRSPTARQRLNGHGRLAGPPVRHRAGDPRDGARATTASWSRKSSTRSSTRSARPPRDGVSGDVWSDRRSPAFGGSARRIVAIAVKTLVGAAPPS